MRGNFRIVSTAISALALIGAIGFSATVSADPMEDGKKLAFNKKKGNCLACHLIPGGEQPGNIAPPLIGMKARFPDKAKLRAQIAEPRTANPNTMMPPFSAHGILSDKEIDLVVDFIYSL
jgi:sulfur-oxidizing protein SoxX